MLFRDWTAFIPLMLISDELIILDLLFVVFHMLLVVIGYVFLPSTGLKSLHKEMMVVYCLHLNL